MNYYTELGVKGFCFRAFPDNAAVANMVKSCGLDRIDLSGPQLDFRNPSLHAPAIRAYAEAGVKIVGIGVVGLSGGVDDEELFRFCRSAGCRTISINGEPGTFYEALKQAEAWAGKYDMRLAIHNHGGNHWLGNSQMLRHVLSRCGERVGICLDTAWCLQASENPMEWLDIFAGRVHAVHFKDFVFDRRGGHRDAVIGDGALDLPAFVERLRSREFDGPAVIEYEGDVNDPVPALCQCVARMRNLSLKGAH
jgi:inosose dehydratase